MARETSYKKNSKQKQVKFHSPWLKNALRSVGAISRESFKEISPTMYEVSSSFKQAGSKINKSNVKSLADAIRGNEYVRSGQNLIKYALEDIKSGKFYNEERADSSVMSEMGFDEIESGTFFEDWDSDNNDENSDGTSVNVVNNIAGLEAVGTAIVSTANASNTTNLKIGKAQVDALVAVTSAQMAQQNELGSAIVSELSNISNGINSLVAFQNENMLAFIEQSTAYMEKLGAVVGKQEDEIESADKLSIMTSKKGGFSGSNYAAIVKKQLKETTKSNLGMLSMLQGPMLEMAISNPLGFIGEMALTSMTPKVMKNMMEEIDDALAGFIPSFLNKVAGFADTGGTDFKSKLLRNIGSVFGVKTSRKSEFDLYNKVNTEAATFDGVTRHSITELIPKYLRESTSYLKEIARSMGVDVKKAQGNAEIFNVQEGKYTRVKDVREEMMGDIRRSILDTFRESKFGETLAEIGSSSLNDKDAERFNKTLEKLFIAMERYGKFIDPTNLSVGSDLDTIINGLGLSDGEANHLRASLRLTNARSPIASNNLNATAERARRARNSRIDAFSENPELYNTYAISDLGDSIDATLDKTFTRTFGEIRKGDTPIGDTLRNIQFLLNRGINVRVVGSSSGQGYDRGYAPFQSYVANKPRPNLKGKEVRFSSTNRTFKPGGNFNSSLTEEEAYQRMAGEFGEGSVSEHNSEFGRSMATAMQSILSGKFDIAMADIGNAIWQKASGVGSYINKEFLTPMKDAFFGEKNSDGYRKDGLIAGVQNKFLDSFRNIKREFTGKGYTDSFGNRVADKTDDEESVVGNIKKLSSSIKEGVMTKLFGEKDDTGKRNKEGFMSSAVKTMQEGFAGFAEAFFGKEFTEEDKKEILNKAKEEMIDRLPRTMTGMLGGITFNALAGSSLLGGLIGGPIGAALIGGTIGFASKSEKFQEYLFGKEGENGKWIEGLISKKLQDEIREKKNYIIGGAAIGMGKNILFGKTGGLLGSLVGGPVAGAIIGSLTGYALKTEAFHNFLYGKEGTWQKGIINQFKGIFKNSKGESTEGSRALGMSLIGTGGGALTGAALSATGLLPAFFSPLGPIGGALLGLGVGIKASKNDFRTWFFGKDVLDEDGNLIMHKKGVLGRFGTLLDAEIFKPFKSGAANFLEDTRNYFIDKIAAPIEFSLIPITTYAKNLTNRITDRIKSFGDNTKKFFKDQIFSPIADHVRKYILTPTRRLFGGFFKVFTGLTKTIISTPFTALGIAGNFADSRNRARSRKEVLKENAQQGLRGRIKNLGIRMHFGNMYRDASEAYSPESRERRERWTNEYIQDRDRRLEEAKQNRAFRARRDYNARLIARYTNNNFSDDTFENRMIAQRMYDDDRRRQGKRTKQLRFKGEATMESSRMSDSDILRGDSRGLNTEQRQLQWTIKIANILQGKNPDGSPGDEEENPFFARGKRKETEEERRNRERTWAEDNDDDNEPEPEYGRGADNVDRFFDWIENSRVARFASRVHGGINSKVGQAYGKVKNFFHRRRGDYAEGGETANAGLSLVGENGPEIIYQNKGNRIFPNGNDIPVYLTGLSETAKKIFNNTISESTSKGTEDGIRKSEANVNAFHNTLPALLPAPKDGIGTALVAGSYKETQEKKSEALTIANQNESLLHLRNIDETTKRHSGLWSSIFSKKGLITGGLILLAPLLLKFLKKALNLDFSGLNNTIQRILGDIDYNNENRGNGDTAQDKIEENIEETEDLLTGNWSAWVAPDGQWDHQSESKVNVSTVPLRKGARLFTKGKKIYDRLKDTRLGRFVGRQTSKLASKVKGSKLGQAVGKGISGVKNFFGKGFGKNTSTATGLVPYGYFDDAAEETAKNSGRISKAFGKVKGAASKVASKLTGKGSSKVAYDVIDEGGQVVASFGKNHNVLKTAGEGNKKILTKILQALDTAIGHVSEFLVNHGFSSASKLGTMLKSVKDICVKYIGKISPKVSAIIGGSTALGAATGGIGLLAKEATWITLGAINGASGTAKLFYIDKEDVDWKMRLISTAIGGLKGSTVGAIIDVVNAILVEITGLDIFHEIACTAYDIIASNEDYEDLMTSKEDFKQQYESYKKDTLYPQYQEYLAELGKTEDELTFDQYLEGVGKGDIKAKVKSFQDYNTEKHKSLGDRVGSGIAAVGRGVHKVGSTIAGGVKKAGSAVVNTAKDVGHGVATVAKKGVNKAKEIGHGIAGVAKTGWRNTKEFGSNVKNTFMDKTKGIRKFGSNMALGTYKLASNAKDAVVDEVTKLAAPKIEAIKGGINTMHGWVSDIGGEIGDWAEDTGKKVENWGTNVADGIKSFGGSAAKKAGEVFDKAKGIGGWIKNTGLSIGKTVSSGNIVNLDSFNIDPNDPYAGIKEIGAKAISISTMPSSMVFQFGHSAFDGIKTIAGGVSDAGKKVKNFAANAIDKAGKGLLDFSEKYKNNPGQTLGELYEGITSTVGGIVMHPVDSMSKLFSVAGKGFSTLFKGVTSVASTVQEAVTPSASLSFDKYFSNPNKKDGIFGGVQQLMFSIGRLVAFIPWLLGKGLDTINEKIQDSFIGKTIDKAKGILGKIGLGGNGGYGSPAVVGGGYGEKPDIVNGFPYFSQKDSKWANKSYSKKDNSDNATYGEAGCGPTAMAMAINGVNKTSVDPVELGRLAQNTGYRDNTGTNWNFVDTASAAYGMNAMRRDNPDASFINAQLEQGHPVVLSGTSDNAGPYTTAGHYIVAVGKDKNGNILVNDPRGKSYSKSYSPDQLASKTGAAWGIFKGGYGRIRNTINRMRGKHRKGGGFGADPKWISIVKSVKQAIAAQKPGYSQSNYITISVGGKSLRVRTDCSGFVGACLKFYGVLNENTNVTSSSFTNGGNSDVKGTNFGHLSWQGWDSLEEGDIIALNGHVEIFCRNEGGKHYVYNCGSDTSVNTPTETVTGHPNGYTDVWRPGSPGEAVVSGTATSVSTTGTSGFTSKLDRVSEIISTAAELGYQGSLTGDWSTSLSQALAGSNSGDASVSTNTSGSASSANMSGNSTKEKVFSFFVNNGYSKEMAAGIMGNMQQESGINPSVIQNNGRGPAAGIVQWENYNTKSQRWKQMSDYANSKGKDWTDLGSQLEFLDMELAARGNVDTYTNYLIKKKYGSYDQFKRIGDINKATLAFEETFERAGKPMMENRYRAAKQYYDMYANGGNGGGYGETKQARVNLSNVNTSQNRSTRVIGSVNNIDKQFAKEYLSTSNNYIASNSNRGGYGSNRDIMDSIDKVITVLQQIASTADKSNDKLDLLNRLKVSGGSGNGLNTPSRKDTKTTNNNQNIIINNNKNITSTPSKPNKNMILANKIASGLI